MMVQKVHHKRRQQDASILNSFLGEEPELSTTNSCLGPVEPGDVLFERFAVEEMKAKGGFCVIHLARDLKQGKPVAVKSILLEKVGRFDSLIRKQFRQECSLMKRVRHPAFPQFIKKGQRGDHSLLIMEWLEGETLTSRLQEFKGLEKSLDESMHSVHTLCSAVQYLHHRNIVHADLKPGNIFFEKQGKTRLLDLGSAVRFRSTENGDESPSGSDIPALLTPAFSSPQHLEGYRPQPADDLFSLACLVCIMIDGVHPFGYQNALEAQTAGDHPRVPNQCTPQQQHALTHALSFCRETRKATLDKFWDNFSA